MTCSKKLLEPGWAGMLDLEEAKYIQGKLSADVNLRRVWKIRGKKPSLSVIAAKAYPEDPVEARRYIANQQVVASRRNRLSG